MMMAKLGVLEAVLLAAVLCGAAPLKNGAVWYDTNGYPINAHAGSVVNVKGRYWWYGEHKVYGKAGNKSHVGVHAYSSDDLVTWTDEGVVFAMAEDPTVPETDGCVFEEAKVIYRPEVGQFIMFSHLEPKGHGYNDGLTLISRANKPNEPFRRMRILNPFGRISRDMNVFTDDDGKHYPVYASTWNNRTMYIDQLTEDCKDYTGVSYKALEEEMCEAPMMLKHNGWYFMVCSKCTGWKPNTARLYRTKSLAGPWEYLGNPCTGGENPFTKMGPDKTWGGQSCSFIKVADRKDTYIAMFDVWNPDNQLDSRYLFLPVILKGDMLEIPWRDTFEGLK